MSNIKQKKTHSSVTEGSAIQRYKNIIVGKPSLRALIYYECCMWLSMIPGALGLVLRKIFWPRMFGSCGKGVLFGQFTIVRHPHRIHLGNKVVISENCILDARHDECEEVIKIGDNVILSNNVMLSCKNGTVQIGQYCGIGPQTIIQSTNHCNISIGSDVVIGSQCYIVGGGNYHIDRLDTPMWRQGIQDDGGVQLQDDIWIGSQVTILGGVTMGSGSVAGASSLINKSVPDHSINVGVPAKIVKSRNA